MDRRTFLRRSAAFGGGLALAGPFHSLGLRLASGQPPLRITGYGPLIDKGELALPAAFEYEVISRQGEPMSDGSLTPGCFDGMGAFPGPHKTTVLIRNHENRIARRAVGTEEVPVIVPPGFAYDTDPAYSAGCTKLMVRREPGTNVYTRVNDFAILGGTDNNCAGGVLPFGKWLTCEEVVRRSLTGKKHGYVFEVDASAEGPVEARPITAMGRFVHEATVWHGGIYYLTEDRTLAAGGSCFYRFLPERQAGPHENLADIGGVLQALKLRDEPNADMDIGRSVGVPYPVEWVTIDDPDHDDDTDSRRDLVSGLTPVRFQAQAQGAAVFDRQEGMWVGPGSRVHFDCTTGGALDLGQVWQYHPGKETLTLIFESPSVDVLEGPDNVVIVPSTGDILLCEDAVAPQFIRGLTRSGEIYDFAEGLINATEFAGACFAPDGHTLYVNQYGARGSVPAGPAGQGGVTYAIYGPFASAHRQTTD
jgi:secreted PhoX family phosphatase